MRFALPLLFLLLLTACSGRDDDPMVAACPTHWTAQASLWVTPAGQMQATLAPADIPCAAAVNVCPPAGPCVRFDVVAGAWQEAGAAPQAVLDAAQYSDGHTVDAL